MEGELTQKEMIIHTAPKADVIETTRIILLRIWVSEADPSAEST